MAEARAILSGSGDFAALSSALRGGMESTGMLDYKVLQTGRAGMLASSLTPPNRIVPVQMKVTCEVKIAHGNDDQLACIALCGDALLVGTTGGVMSAMTWDGEVIWKVHVPELLRTDDALRKLGVGAYEEGSQIDVLVKGEGQDTGGGIVSLHYSEGLELCGVVLGCGASLLVSIKVSGPGSPSAVDGRWLRSSNSVSIVVQSERMIATVGLSNGDIEHFYVGVPAGDRCPVMRKLSLSGWYFDPEDVGAAKVLSWSPDGSALAVGWERRGLAVWSVSGCRLMWTLPQIGGALPTTPSRRYTNGETFLHPMESGVRAAAWGPEGYFLWASPRRTKPPHCSPYHFMEFDFCKSGVVSSASQNEPTRLAMIGSNRILILGAEREPTLESEWQQILIPVDYLWANWPPMHIAVNNESTYVAVAGATGLACCNIRSQRWHIFGDIGSQSEPIRCCALGWFQKWMIVGNRIPGESGSSASYELLFYPRDPMDSSVLQAHKKLASKPLLIDVRADGYLLILGEDSMIIMLRMAVVEQFRTKRIQVEDVYKLFLPTRERMEPPTSEQNALVLTAPGGGISNLRIFPPLDHALQNERDSIAQRGEVIDEKNLRAAMPTQMLLLRTTGSVILLDARKMISVPLL